jgi:hypothetical protein
MNRVNEESLKWAHRRQEQKKAVGIDGTTNVGGREKVYKTGL